MLHDQKSALAPTGLALFPLRGNKGGYPRILQDPMRAKGHEARVE
jgi:hypothetical protein